MLGFEVNVVPLLSSSQWLFVYKQFGTTDITLLFYTLVYFLKELVKVTVCW